VTLLAAHLSWRLFEAPILMLKRYFEPTHHLASPQPA
jgi:hypothetical protein